MFNSNKMDVAEIGASLAVMTIGAKTNAPGQQSYSVPRHRRQALSVEQRKVESSERGLAVRA